LAPPACRWGEAAHALKARQPMHQLFMGQRFRTHFNFGSFCGRLRLCKGGVRVWARKMRLLTHSPQMAGSQKSLNPHLAQKIVLRLQMEQGAP
jgi:hypothetical protein